MLTATEQVQCVVVGSFRTWMRINRVVKYPTAVALQSGGGPQLVVWIVIFITDPIVPIHCPPRSPFSSLLRRISTACEGRAYMGQRFQGWSPPPPVAKALRPKRKAKKQRKAKKAEQEDNENGQLYAAGEF